MKTKFLLIPALLVAVATAGYFGFDYYQAERAKQAKVQKELAEKQDKEEKRLAREKEKAECLKEMPYKTLEGFSLCSKVNKIKNIVLKESEESISCLKGRVHKFRYAGKNKHVLINQDSNCDIFLVKIYKEYTYGIEPEYEKILNDLKKINTGSWEHVNWYFENERAYELWCLGDCVKDTDSIEHRFNCNSHCLTFRHEDGNFYRREGSIAITLQNTVLENKFYKSVKEENQRKANEF